VTIRRFELVPIIGTGETGYDENGEPNGKPEDPYRPDITDSHNVIGRIGNRVLVKRLVPDGTPVTPTTLADVTANGFDIQAQNLTAGQKAAAKTFLQNNGIDVSDFDTENPDDRKKLLVFALTRAFGWDKADLRRALTDYNAVG
jgi:hypothetical protein